jgi:NADPH:quinone reductase
MASMQAIHVADPSAGVSGLELTSQPIPSISSPYDVLVKVNAAALNPIDTKKRQSFGGENAKGTILGYDGAGVVVDVGSQTKFSKGDAVLYAGDVTRPGSNAQYQIVDSRIVAKKPEGLAWDEAAALPLVGLTAWEMFQDKFGLKPVDNSKEVLLVVNGAGGVGSMAIQLAKKVRNLNISPHSAVTSLYINLRSLESSA